MMNLPTPLVSTEWLAQHLQAPELRIFDATVFLHINAQGPGYIPESGRAKWAEDHIPGASFIDLLDDFSDAAAPVRFTMPDAATFARLAGPAGIGDDSYVVVYSAGSMMWSTRFWWMLRSMGFDRAAVLDGGWEKWAAEGRPTSRDSVRPTAANFTAKPRPGLWANKSDMLAAIQDGTVCTINALSPEVYTGSKNMYGRAGHIPGSHNVFYNSLLEIPPGTYLSADQLEQRFKPTGALDKSRVIAYCGGGISATMDALALTLLGHPGVSVYDGSMMEWVADPALPLALGEQP